ncbi:MAG: riboflavin synthase [Opitutales bacterium]|nr:riboflavin synthase [Opitutales bacterium]MCH8541470.1 riboflavin synthase [Opitutales bacterium]
MFTGIVEETGVLASLEKLPEGWRLWVRAKKALENLNPGDSIAVNGCCLTAADQGEGQVGFDLLEETMRCTSFGSLREGDLLNLERSLRFDGKVGGHFVSGHVDTVGKVEEARKVGADTYLSISYDGQWDKLVVPKGSIAIEGVSLTAAEVRAKGLAVWLIPHTLELTNLKAKKPGDQVNLEFDMLGKQVEKLVQAYLENREGM